MVVTTASREARAAVTAWAARYAWPVRDPRTRRDLHALDDDGMVLCNPRDREAAHRAEVEGIATEDRAAVTCRKCLDLLGRDR